MRVRASDDRNQLALLDWKSFQNGAPLFGVTGRFLEVEIDLTSDDPDANPSVDKIVVQKANEPNIELLNRENDQVVTPGKLTLEGQAKSFETELLADLTENPTDLTRRGWNIAGVGNGGNIWDGSSIVFTSQIDDGSEGFDVEGYFDWISTNTTRVGRETFTGKLNSDGSLELYHEGLEPIPGLGGPTTDPANYFARLSDDGNEIVDGIWVPAGTNITRGTWGAQLSSISATIENPRTFPNQIIDVRVNDQPVNVLDPTGSFFTNIDIKPGWNEYLIEATDIFGVTGNRTLRLFGQTEVSEIDFDQFVDITGSFSGVYGRTSFEDRSETLFVDLATRNDGVFVAEVPLYVGVTNISNPRVQLVGTDGVTPDGVPFYDFSEFIAGGQLGPNELSESPTIAFLNPDREKFDYELVFYTKLNAAPEIISLPTVEALVGRTYEYDVDAIDADGDALTYSLVQSPSGMAIDAETGLIEWTPDAEDIGNYDIAVLVDDGRGGKAEQRFTLSVIEAPPNRPPVITSDPVTIALATSVELGEASEFSVSGWQQVNLTNDGDTPRWVFPSSTQARQLTNASQTALVGFDELLNARVSGRFGVQTTVDDDEIGFVFGYQDPQNYYRFSWAQGTLPQNQNNTNNNVPGFVVSRILSDDQGATTTQVVYRNQDPFDTSLGWRDNQLYSFELDTYPGGFAIRVIDGVELLETITVNDGEFAGGRFGFYNSSQQNAYYEGFVQQFLPPPTYIYEVSAVDPDGDELSYALSEAPVGMRIDSQNGVISWGPTIDQIGNHDVTIRVEDGRGGVAEQSFVVAVKSPLPGTTEQIVETDLTIGDVQTDNLNFDPQLLTVTGEISATVANLGPNATPASFDVFFFEDLDGDQRFSADADNLLGQTKVSDQLDPNQQLEVTAALAGSVQFANTVIYAFVDANEAIDETDETNNIASKVCEAIPTIGGFDPVFEWKNESFETRPESNQVITTPMVADINGDGFADVIVGTFTPNGRNTNTRVNGVLRVLDGRDGSEIWSINDSSLEINSASAVAVGDIDDDGTNRSHCSIRVEYQSDRIRTRWIVEVDFWPNLGKCRRRFAIDREP